MSMKQLRKTPSPSPEIKPQPSNASMKILIHSPIENTPPEEKKRFLQRIQPFRIAIEKNEPKETDKYMYFVRGQYKYSRTDPALIEAVEKIKNQSIAKKGCWEGPWDILEHSIAPISQTETGGTDAGGTEEGGKTGNILLPPEIPTVLPKKAIENIPEMEYRPSIEFATWNAKIQRVNRQYKSYTPFPVWIYNIRLVHKEMDRIFWILEPIARKQ